MVTTSVFATVPPGLVVNGKPLPVDIIIENGKALVPLRNLCEELNIRVEWNETRQSVLVRKDNLSVELIPGGKVAEVNGRSVSLDTPASLVNGKVLVPIRFLAENLGMMVNWDANNNAVTISTLNPAIDPIIENPADAALRMYPLLFNALLGFMENTKAEYDVSYIFESDFAGDIPYSQDYPLIDVSGDRISIEQMTHFSFEITGSGMLDGGDFCYVGKDRIFWMGQEQTQLRETRVISSTLYESIGNPFSFFGLHREKGWQVSPFNPVVRDVWGKVITSSITKIIGILPTAPIQIDAEQELNGELTTKYTIDLCEVPGIIILSYLHGYFLETVKIANFRQDTSREHTLSLWINDKGAPVKHLITHSFFAQENDVTQKTTIYIETTYRDFGGDFLIVPPLIEA